MTASVSGLNAQGQAISVISDNLSNTNTIGYKASRSLFSQMVTSSGVSGTSYNAGGTAASVGRDQGAQGSFVSSTSTTDLAISGNGFFRVADNKTNTTSTGFYFTRAGSFSQDKEGFLVNPDGYYLQGWKTDTDGTILNVQEPTAISLQSVGISAQPTTEFSLDANLNSTTVINPLYSTSATRNAALDAMLSDTSKADFTTDIRVYDAQGGARDMTVLFSKNSANSWDWQMVTDGSNVQGGVPGTTVRVGSGSLEFNSNGSLKNMKYDSGTALDIQWAGGVNASSISLNFGDFTGGKIVTGTTAGLQFADGVLNVTAEKPGLAAGTYTLVNTAANQFTLTTPMGTDVVTVNTPITGTQELYFANSGVRITIDDTFDPDPGAGTYTPAVNAGTFTVGNVGPLDKGLGTDGITQLSAAFNTSAVNQNGFGAGTLSSIAIDADGFVNGTFTNGEVKKLYKVALAVFQNPNGLEVVNGSLLRTTDASGQALLKEPGVGGTGSIIGGSLEGSTTDIAGEFSNMIIAQRAFQASSKVITTVDQMLNELLQLR
jgi:flagellar hook protein FlgE